MPHKNSPLKGYCEHVCPTCWAIWIHNDWRCHLRDFEAYCPQCDVDNGK